MLHEECRACRSTVYSFCNNNWLVVTLFIVSISRTDSTQFHQQAERRLRCKRTRVQKTQLQASKPDIHIFFHDATAPSGTRPPYYRGFTITDTPHSARFLWTSDQPDAETSTWQHTTLTSMPRLDSIPQS